MSEKKIIVLVVIGLILSVVCVGSGSYALYKTANRGHAMGSIANWNFSVNGSKSIFKINLATNSTNTVNGALAPGSYGSFDINLDATNTDCDVEYKISFLNVVGKPEHLRFYTDKEYKEEVDIKSATNSINGIIKRSDETMKKVVTIYWIWESNTGIDNADTMSKQMSFDIAVVGSQVT